MAHVAGPKLGWLDERGDAFAAAVMREVKNTLASTAPRVNDIEDLNVIRTLWAQSAKLVLLQYVSKAWRDSVDDTYQQLEKAAQKADQARPQRLVAALRRLQPTHPMALTASIKIAKVVNDLAELFLEGALNRLVAIGDFIWNTARAQLLEGMKAGEGVVELRDRVVATTGLVEARATAIARTEVVGASNIGSYMQMKATGLKAQKEWIATTDDGRTRPSHEHVDGEWVSIDEKFIVGGWPMAFPHDQSAPAGETVNCRCTLGWDIPDDELLQVHTSDELTAALESFHLPGVHDQSEHGRKGGRHFFKVGKPIKVTHGLVHKKHADHTTIAITKDGNKKATWNGKSYNLDTKQSDGTWKTEKTAIKSKAYVAINGFASDWHEAIEDTNSRDTSKPKTPSAPAAPAAPTPSTTGPKKLGPGSTVEAKDVATYGLKAGEPIELTQAMFNKKFKAGTIIAVNKDASKKLTDYGHYHSMAEKDANGNWSNIVDVVDKTKVLGIANDYEANWHEAVHATEKAAPTPKVTPPSAPSAPAAKPTYTPMQKAYTLSIFGSNGVKWHSDSKKIYDSALEVSQKDSSLSMADALEIMDQSLKKKTGDPFRTKMNKFLSTKAGMKYAEEKGGSAPAGSTKQVIPPVKPKQLNPPVGNPRKINKAIADKMQDDMHRADPPPWNGVQRAALKYYTGHAYTAINKCLRGTGECSTTVLNNIKHIKAAMKPSTESIILHRKTNAATFGVTSPADMEKLVGKTVRDKGVISTSISAGVWHGEIYLDIEAPVGTKMAWVQPISNHPTENEMVLAPGSQFEILSAVPHPDYPHARIVKVRVVPGSSLP